MRRYVLGRLLQAIFAIWVVSVIVFSLARLSGDPISLLLPQDATDRDRAMLASSLGLDKPIVVQYGVFLLDMARLDFGQSIKTRRPVAEMIAERLPATIELGLVGILFSLVVSLPVGVYSAARRGGFIDFVGRMFAVLGQSMPSFWTGILLMYLFAVQLRWLPTAGIGGANHFILPAVTLGWYISAGIMRLTRSSMLDVLSSDYVLLARIKGLSEFKVLWKHAFRNAALPVMTYATLLFVMALGGTIVVETVFAWPGVGRLAIQSISYRDFPVVQVVVLMLSVMYVGANLVVDLLYAYLNPKIRYGAAD